MAVGEWDQRQLCSDGGCVGVIGPDGTCKVCGRAAQGWGDERNRGLIAPADDAADAPEDEADEDLEADAADDEYEDDDLDDDEEYEDEDADEDAEGDGDRAPAPLAASAATASPVEWGTRELCPDGGCVGVIGADGRCKVCGRAGENGAARLSPAGDAPTVVAAPAGFTVVTTETAVATTDDAVQTTASTIKTDDPDAAVDPGAPEPPADREPGSKDPAS